MWGSSLQSDQRSEDARIYIGIAQESCALIDTEDRERSGKEIKTVRTMRHRVGVGIGYIILKNTNFRKYVSRGQQSG